jgi:hypothetical protein
VEVDVFQQGVGFGEGHALFLGAEARFW